MGDLVGLADQVKAAFKEVCGAPGPDGRRVLAAAPGSAAAAVLADMSFEREAQQAGIKMASQRGAKALEMVDEVLAKSDSIGDCNIPKPVTSPFALRK